ncbi:MAG: GNAT family N-acetyltransferase [Coriobacteriaceae bacterium]
MELFSTRLALRPWTDADAPALFELARDPRVGTAAGWPPHTSEEQSLDILRNVLQGQAIRHYIARKRRAHRRNRSLTGDAIISRRTMSIPSAIGSVCPIGSGFAAEAFSASSTTLAIPGRSGHLCGPLPRVPSHRVMEVRPFCPRKPLTSFIRQASVTCSSCGASLFRISKMT